MGLGCNSFVVGDAKKCIGCKRCEIACFKAHNNVTTVGNIKTPIIPRLHVIRGENFVVPIQCRHCENAPCAKVCPVNAITNKDNSVIVDEEICIGCKACAIACPFGAIEIATAYKDGKPIIQQSQEELTENGLEKKEKKIAYKCDLCKDIGRPACIEVCPKNALKLFDPSGEVHSKKIKTAESLTQEEW